MLSKLNTAFGIYRREGLVELLRRTKEYLIEDIYWRVRTTRPIEIEGLTTRYYTSDRGVIDELNFFVKNEQLVLKDMLNEVEAGDVIYDIGANIGIYSCFLASSEKSGRVVAFEPYPPNLNELYRNIELNNQDVQVVAKAVADAEGSVQMQQQDGERVDGSASLVQRGKGDGISIDAVSVDNMVADGSLPLPNVVKIDVEGAESLVVEGMEETLQSETCHTIYCEIHNLNEYGRSVSDFGGGESDIVETLRDAGFEVERLSERTDQLLLKGTK